MSQPLSPFNPEREVGLSELFDINTTMEIDIRLQDFPLGALERLDLSSPSGDHNVMTDVDIDNDLKDALFSGDETMSTSSVTAIPVVAANKHHVLTDADINADLEHALWGDRDQQEKVDPTPVLLPAHVAPVDPTPVLLPSPDLAPVAPAHMVANSIFAPQIIPAFQQTLFNMSSFVTGTSPTQPECAFNLLGCILYMKIDPQQGRTAALNVYGNRPEIIAQLQTYVEDESNGVTHDAEGRSVVIKRSPLYALIKGEYIINEDDKILKYFGNEGKTHTVKDPNIRKYLSGLKTQWDSNRVRGGTNTYLNTFEYIHGASKACRFKFLY